MKKNILIIFGMVVIGLIVFACCSKQSISTPSVPTSECDGSCHVPRADFDAAPVETNTLVSQENWQFSLPGNTWAEAQSPIPEVKAHFNCTDRDCRILFLKEPTTVTYSQYIVNVLKDLRSEGIAVESAKLVIINNTKFVLVHFGDEDTAVWVWITVKDGFGYDFSCGGKSVPDAGNNGLRDLCQSVADTLQIK